MPKRYFEDIIGASINFDAPVQITAAEGDDENALKRFSMVAYTGVKMKLFGGLVVDLEGLELPAANALPILRDHDMTQIVGHGTARIEGGQVLIDGVVSGASDAAREVSESSRNGFPWQSSIGAEILRVEDVEAGGSVNVNGMDFEGPLLVVRGSRLFETSFVPAGADANTSARVAAKRVAHHKGLEMNFEKWLIAKGFGDVTDEAQLETLRAAFDSENKPAEKPEPESVTAAAPVVDPMDAVKAERERVAAIQAACAGEHPEIEREAIAAGSTVEETNAKIIAAIRAARPQIMTRGEETRQDSRNGLAASLAIRAGFDEDDIAAGWGEKAVEAARKARGVSLREFCRAGLQLENIEAGHLSDGETLSAAASTVSIPGILSDVMNKAMLRQYRLQNITAPTLCRAGDLADFKTANRYRLNEIGDMEKVGPDGKIKHGTLGEESATNKLSTYGKRITFTRQMLIDDDLDALMGVVRAMGGRAAQKIDRIFYEELLGNANFTDGTPLFDAGHNNYADGATTALDVGSMDQAMQLFNDQVDADGQPIGVTPKFLLVPTSLNFTANQVVNSAWLNAKGSTDGENITTHNPIVGQGIQVIMSPWLNNGTFTGSSALAWYLFGDPAIVDTFEIGYLRGQRTPVIERFDAGVDTLGMSWRIYFDIGIKPMDFRGMVKMKGEA